MYRRQTLTCLQYCCSAHKVIPADPNLLLDELLVVLSAHALQILFVSEIHEGHFFRHFTACV